MNQNSNRKWLGMGWITGVISRLYHVQTRSGAHLVAYSVSTSGSFPKGKTVGAWNWPLTSIKYDGCEYVELYLHSILTVSRINKRDTFVFTLPLIFVQVLRRFVWCWNLLRLDLYPFQILGGLPAVILTDVFCGFHQCLHENSMISYKLLTTTTLHVHGSWASSHLISYSMTFVPLSNTTLSFKSRYIHNMFWSYWTVIKR
jgi:hypothetical protein